MTAGDPLVRLFGEKKGSEESIAALAACFTVVREKVDPDPLIYKIVT